MNWHSYQDHVKQLSKEDNQKSYALMRGISLEKISYSRGKREIEKNLKNAKRIEMSRKHQINEKKSKFAKNN